MTKYPKNVGSLTLIKTAKLQEEFDGRVYNCGLYRQDPTYRHVEYIEMDEMEWDDQDESYTRGDTRSYYLYTPYTFYLFKKREDSIALISILCSPLKDGPLCFYPLPNIAETGHICTNRGGWRYNKDIAEEIENIYSNIYNSCWNNDYGFYESAFSNGIDEEEVLKDWASRSRAEVLLSEYSSYGTNDIMMRYEVSDNFKATKEQIAADGALDMFVGENHT